MEFSNETMDTINTLIVEHLNRKNQNHIDENGLPLFPPTLSYSLNDLEISAAEEELSQTNKLICLVKTNYKGDINICYYKHHMGNFIISFDVNNQVLTVG